MDGHLVPNISFGLPVIEAVRKTTQLELDTHLMLQNPAPFIAQFKEAGSDSLTIHVEIDPDPAAILADIRRHGLKCGLAVNPATPVEALFPHLDNLDLALVMSVEPGFGGQAFQSQALTKIRDLAAEYQVQKRLCRKARPMPTHRGRRWRQYRQRRRLPRGRCAITRSRLGRISRRGPSRCNRRHTRLGFPLLPYLYINVYLGFFRI